MTFGERIRYARNKKGFTQRELADIIKAKHNSVSNWENDQNKPDPDTIELICGALDVTPSFLMGYNEIVEFDFLKTDDFAKRMRAYYNAFYPDNKEKLIKYAEALLNLQRQEDILNAAHERTNVTMEEKQNDENIMNDENF